MRLNLALITLLALANVGCVHAQSNAIQLCDQQTTAHCITYKAPATLPANVACTLGTTGFSSCSAGSSSARLPTLWATDLDYNGTISAQSGSALNLTNGAAINALSGGSISLAAGATLFYNPAAGVGCLQTVSGGLVTSTGAACGGQWLTSGSDIHYDAGRVGIKTFSSTMTHDLEVGGTAYISGATSLGGTVGVTGALTAYGSVTLNTLTGGSTRCLQVSSAGLVSATTTACPTVAGDAFLAGGTSLSPQIFTGYNIFSNSTGTYPGMEILGSTTNAALVLSNSNGAGLGIQDSSSGGSSFTKLSLAGTVGSIQCLQANTAGLISGVGAPCVSTAMSNSFSATQTFQSWIAVNSYNTGSVLLNQYVWQPANSSTVSLGDSTHKFANVYADTIYAGSGCIGCGPTGGTLPIVYTGVGTPITCPTCLTTVGSQTITNADTFSAGITVGSSYSVSLGGVSWMPTNNAQVSLGDTSHRFNMLWSSGIDASTGLFSSGIQAGPSTFYGDVQISGGNLVNRSGSTGQVTLGNTEWQPLNDNIVALGDASHHFGSGYFGVLYATGVSSTTLVGSTITGGRYSGATAGTPTVSGGSCALSAGSTDTRGQVNPVPAGTICNVSFSAAYSTTPVCTLGIYGSGVQLYGTYTTGFAVYNTSGSTATASYICMQ